MPPNGECRVCGDPSIDTMPCWRCCGLLLDRDNERLDSRLREKARAELIEIVKGRKG